MDAPYIKLTLRDGKVAMMGTARFFAGHRIPRPAVDDGVFASWQWLDNTLTVSNDRYGLWPLYYASMGSTLIVSPSIETLLGQGAPRALDDDAIAVFLRLNFFIGDDTAFTAIKSLPPAARLSWCEGKLYVEDRRPPNPKPLAISRSSAIDEFIDRFRTAIDRRLPGGEDAALPLSGGRDSRHILLALHRARVPLRECVTVRHYPPRPNQDAQIAAVLAARLGLRHIVVGPPATRIAAERRKNVLTQFCSDEHVQFLPLREHLQRRPATVYDGIAGDTLVQSWAMPPAMMRAFADGDVATAAQTLFEYDPPGFERPLTSLLTRSATRRFSYERARDRLCHEVRRHIDGPNPANAFVFWNRTRREVAMAPYGLLAFLPRVFAPFLDWDVYDLLASLPVSLLMDGQFQPDALKRAFPEFADIPFESQTPHGQHGRFARQVAIELARFARHPSALYRRGYVVSRAAAAWTQGHAARLWFLRLVVWLQQIEALERGERPC